MYKLIIYVVDFTIKVSIVAFKRIFVFKYELYIYIRLLAIEILRIVFPYEMI